VNAIGGAGAPGAEFVIRGARPEDSARILKFIEKLADYDGEKDQIAATAEDIRESLFGKKQAEVIFGEENGEPVAFAVYFQNYSTFLGKANLYLEDLFVEERCRGRGYGKAMLRRLAEIAVRRGFERLDWLCLNSKTGAVGFYERLGAAAFDDRKLFRLQGDALRALADVRR
jgi:GNAT superfamily N-acetyltransferase